jgi:uncharacterized protein YcfJ
MRTTVLYISVVVVSLVFLGCESMGPNSKKGVGVGAILGSVAGGVVGHQSGRGVEGALIGGAVGGGAGGMIGSGMDDQHIQQAKASHMSNVAQISILRIVEMTEKGLPDSVIIDEIKTSGSVYDLDMATIQYLKNQQVSDLVIDYMMKTKK